MRAFLSTGHAGFDKLRPDLYEADAAYIDRVTCSEARAILAETEPTGPGTLSAYAALPTDYPGICGCRASGIPHSRSEHSPLHPMWDEGFALAKALRAFVEA